MEIKQIIIGALLLIIAMSGALAQCASIEYQGDHLMFADQYSEQTVKLVASSSCTSLQHYKVTVYSDIPVKVTPNSFNLVHGSRVIEANIRPGGVEPGLYTVHFLMESTQEIAREEFVVKVSESDSPLIAEVPAVMRIPENEEFSVAVSIRNDGDITLHNIVTFIDEEGEERVYAEELASLMPGETKKVNLVFAPRPRGDYMLNYTVAAGEYKFRGQTEVLSSNKNYPLSTVLTVKGHDDGYLVEYLVKNYGAKDAKNLFLTIEDAPSDWGVISPSVFSLAPGEAREVELVVAHGEDADATVTVALYEGQSLRAEDTVELSQERLRGTGLISMAESFELGLIILLLAGAGYWIHRLREKSGDKNIDVRTLLPDWAESFWPF